MAIDDEITLKKIEVFLTFMQINNLARVSEILDLSTVSVHRALHSLEEGMRCPLFKREGRNLIPLPSAYEFERYARRMIDDCEEGIRRTREVAGFNAAHLRIGALYSLTLRCIPQLLLGLKLRKPEVAFELKMGSNRELLQLLDEGRLDAIVIGWNEDENPGKWISVPLFHDEIYLAAPLDSPFSHYERIDLQDLRQEAFVALSDGFVTSDSFTHAFHKAGFEPNIKMRVNDIFSLINLVSGGIGYSLLPGRVAEFSSRIKLIPLSANYSLDQRIALLMLKSRERDPNLLALSAECRIYGRQGQHS